MTHRERILATIRGEETDRIPWAPRMDLWYIALRERGTLSRQFEGLNTAAIADVLDVACHAVRADYTLPRDSNDLVLRGLGIDNHPDYPYRVELRDFSVEFQFDPDNLWSNFQTPVGEVTTHLQQTQEMKKNGISLPFVRAYAINSPDDFEAVAQIFEHLEVISTPEAYEQLRIRVSTSARTSATLP